MDGADVVAFKRDGVSVVVFNTVGVTVESGAETGTADPLLVAAVVEVGAYVALVATCGGLGTVASEDSVDDS